MTEIATEYLSLSVTTDVADMLHAFNVARNGSIHNSANECLRAGVKYIVTQMPASTGFSERYEEALRERRRK